MKKSLQQRQEEFLSGLLKYYTKDVKRRCTNGGTCFYSPVNAKNTKSQGCAIGRWLKPELQIELDKKPQSTVEYVFDLLPTNLRNLTQSFLKECQLFHDNNTHWIETGLSPEGKRRLNIIVEDYELNEEKFTKWLLI